MCRDQKKKRTIIRKNQWQLEKPFKKIFTISKNSVEMSTTLKKNIYFENTDPNDMPLFTINTT